MNKDQRKQLDNAVAIINILKEKFDEIKPQIEAIRDENQDSMDNMPEGLQQSERGEQTQSAIDTLELAIENFDEIESNIEALVENMEVAKGE